MSEQPKQPDKMQAWSQLASATTQAGISCTCLGCMAPFLLLMMWVGWTLLTGGD